MSRSRQAYLQRLGIQHAVADDRASAPECVGQEDFRRRFLEKLAYNNVWVPQARRQPRYQTVTIFDWDDTLLCTSWLNQQGDEPLSDDVKRSLRRSAQRVKSMLETAAKWGRTYIVTNAQGGWVEYSAAAWAPHLLPTLRSVPVISARDRFEASFCGDVAQWKVQAFLEVQQQMDPGIITNLLVLGDSNYEMEAARVMSGKFQEVLLKTVKFQPLPNPVDHLKQLELVADKFERIVGTAKGMKVSLERKSATPH
jgi:hypothetical protein